MELYDQLKTTADQDRQLELMREILEIATEQFYVIGISTEAEGYGVVRNNFRNVRDLMPNSFIYPHPAPTNPEQYFFSDAR
jgi:peptide/nickel transport system substrate-binding protein